MHCLQRNNPVDNGENVQFTLIFLELHVIVSHVSYIDLRKQIYYKLA